VAQQGDEALVDGVHSAILARMPADLRDFAAEPPIFPLTTNGSLCMLAAQLRGDGR
jgi:hypothetical protein